jgi:oligoendopeptidase F
VLLRGLGIELSDPAFWERGCRVAERMVEEVEAAVGARP